MRTLKDAKVGETVKVVRLNGTGPLKRRIMDMGITRGVEVYVRKVAPLGDPLRAFYPPRGRGDDRGRMSPRGPGPAGAIFRHSS